MRPRYTAQVERSGRWWAITVPDLPGAFSQSRTLGGVEPMVREAIGLFLDTDESTFDLTIQEVLDPATEDVIRAADAARREAVERQRDAGVKARAAARALQRLGLPQRDIGRLLHLSHQRVAQLLSSAAD
jgi:predicted RNase H-like HicB family nuclease